MAQKLIGTVLFFNEKKGFGFIIPEDGGREVFVHKTGLSCDVVEGDYVEYTLEIGAKGPFAVNVKVIDEIQHLKHSL